MISTHRNIETNNHEIHSRLSRELPRPTGSGGGGGGDGGSSGDEDGDGGELGGLC